MSFLPPWEFQTPLSLGTPRLLINPPRNWLSHFKSCESWLFALWRSEASLLRGSTASGSLAHCGGAPGGLTQSGLWELEKRGASGAGPPGATGPLIFSSGPVVVMGCQGLPGHCTIYGHLCHLPPSPASHPRGTASHPQTVRWLHTPAPSPGEVGTVSGAVLSSRAEVDWPSGTFMLHIAHPQSWECVVLTLASAPEQEKGRGRVTLLADLNPRSF